MHEKTSIHGMRESFMNSLLDKLSEYTRNIGVLESRMQELEEKKMYGVLTQFESESFANIPIEIARIKSDIDLTKLQLKNLNL